MLVTIQFPFIDFRAFVSEETHRLGIPTWPSPVPDHDFVRSFGSVRRRPKGGLTGWLGESFICEANRAITFQGLESLKEGRNSQNNFKIVFRRLYFDGIAVGKFEIGIATWETNESGLFSFLGNRLSNIKLEELISHILQLPVRVQNFSKCQANIPLWQAGKALAKLYLVSSTKKEGIPKRQKSLSDWWVQTCEPIVLISYRNNLERIFSDLPKRKFNFKVAFNSANLSHCAVLYQGRTVRTWLIGEYFPSGNVRQLRIFLLRLHSERACLRKVLQNIASGRLLIKARSQESEVLQSYLNQATRKIRKLNGHASKRAELSIETLAREAEDFIVPGECDAIFEALRALDIRKNLFGKVKDFVGQVSIVERQYIMGDQYNIEQAGAVGPNAYAHDMVFNQVMEQISESTDPIQLATELDTLRQAMLKEATEAEHSIAVGNIAKAEQAVKSNNLKEAIRYLKAAGKWALDIASKIGVPVAIEVLKRALGITI